MDRQTLDRWARRLANGGVRWLHVRVFELPDRELLAALRALRSAIEGPVRLTVNGRPDLCRLAGLDGVHLPTRGLSVEAARRVAGSGSLVGRSAHSLEEVRRAAAEGADYVLFGPVDAPLSKPSQRPAVGLEALAQACAAGPPVYALGGVTIERLAALRAAGAAGAAGISMFDSAAAIEPLVERAAALFVPPSPLEPPATEESPQGS